MAVAHQRKVQGFRRVYGWAVLLVLLSSWQAVAGDFLQHRRGAFRGDAGGTLYYAVAPSGYSYSGAEDARYSTRKYNTLFAAEAALDATPTGPQIIEIIGDWTSAGADTTAVTFSGVATTTDNYVEVVALGAARHLGVWNAATCYRMSISSSSVHVISVSVDHFRIDGVQVQRTSGPSVTNYGITIGSVSSGSETWISNCIIRQSGNASHNEPCINVTQANANVKVWNTICYGTSRRGSAGSAVAFLSAGTLEVYSSTFHGGNYGINQSSGGTLTAKNCYAARGTSGTSDYGGTITKTTCASSDTTGSAGLQSIAHNTSTFTNVTAGSQDYHLPSGSPLIDVGTDTSSDSAPLNFTDDIDGDTRFGTWEVGADSVGTSTATTFAGTTSGLPSGWANQWTATNITFSEGSGYFRSTKTIASARAAQSWNSVGSSIDDCDIVAKVRTDTKGTSDAYIGIAARLGGSPGSETAYVVQLYVSSGVGRLRLVEYNAGTFTSITEDTTIDWAVDTWYYIRFNLSGSALKGKYWLAADSEPGTWNIDTTDATISAGGYVGLFGFAVAVNDCDYFAVSEDSTAPVE